MSYYVCCDRVNEPRISSGLVSMVGHPPSSLLVTIQLCVPTTLRHIDYYSREGWRQSLRRDNNWTSPGLTRKNYQIYNTVQMKLVGWEGEMKWKGIETHVSLRIPFHFFSLEFSPVLTVATGEIRGIKFPQEGNVFLTLKNKWKLVKIFWSDFPRIPLNFARIPQNSPESPGIFP